MNVGSVKKFLKGFILTRPLYIAWRYLLNHKIRKIRKTMRARGIETLFFLEDILSPNSFFYMDMGTMLGIVREGRILGHDLDIDVAVYVENEAEKECVKNKLLSAGCKLRYTYYAETLGTVEHSFELKKLKFDINYYVREGNKDICYLMYRDPQKKYVGDELDVVKLSVTSVRNVKRIPFSGKNVTIPENPGVYLAERYGDNWRIPDVNYVYWKGPSCEYTEYKGYKKSEM